MTRPTVADANARADSAHQKIDDHEKLCAERYLAINNTLADLKTGLKSHSNAAWVIAVALIGWLALQVWEGRNDHPEAAHAVASAPR